MAASSVEENKSEASAGRDALVLVASAQQPVSFHQHPGACVFGIVAAIYVVQVYSPQRKLTFKGGPTSPRRPEGSVYKRTTPRPRAIRPMILARSFFPSAAASSDATTAAIPIPMLKT
jgi:hypothetical protein